MAASLGTKGLRAILAAGILATGTGIALFVYSRGLSVFTVPYLEALEARHRWCSLEGDIVDRGAGPAFFALFGSRYWLGDTGVSLILVGLTIAGLATVLRASAPEPGASWLRTPKSRWMFAAYIFCAVLSMGIAAAISGPRDLERGYVCGEAAARMALFIPVIFGFIGAALAGIGAIIGLGFGRLPASLLRWDRSRQFRSWLVTLLVLAPFLCVGWLMILTMPTSSGFAMPGLIILLYILASIRAALLAPRSATRDQAN